MVFVLSVAVVLLILLLAASEIRHARRERELLDRLLVASGNPPIGVPLELERRAERPEPPPPRRITFKAL